MFRWLPIITCEEKINNHGCWGKHAHIPDNDYWWICLFHVVWTNFFFCNYSYVVHTEYIFISIFIFHSGIQNLPGLQLKGISGNMCCPWKFQDLFVLILCLIKKMNGRLHNYMLGTWEWPQCYFDKNLLPSRISFTLETLTVV